MVNQHYDRPGGVESATPTAWVPQSKPIWLMEIGCPAVDKGANQPNVFVDPKSSENALPYFSRGTRDDLMQRRYLQAIHRSLRSGRIRTIVPGANPVSAVYGGRMVDLDHIHVYCWDARPYPAFPDRHRVWGDGDNWALGHWLNGRLAGGAARRNSWRSCSTTTASIDTIDRALTGTVPGYVIDRIMSARDALQPLELAYFFDVVESGGRIDVSPRAAQRRRSPSRQDDLVEAQGRQSATDADPRPGNRAAGCGQDQLHRRRARLSAGRCRGAAAGRRGGARGAGRAADRDGCATARPLSETWLFESWAARERMR